MLSNGNILFSRMEYIAEITPDKKVVWRYDANASKGTNHKEIHACQPIGLDKVMFVENGLPPKLKIINIKTGAVEVDHELAITRPGGRGIHPQFRRARITAEGTYLIAFLNLGYVAEYDKNFKEIWRYKSTKPWAALRLKNGNTLITDETDNLTREVNRKGETSGNSIAKPICRRNISSPTRRKAARGWPMAIPSSPRAAMAEVRSSSK